MRELWATPGAASYVSPGARLRTIDEVAGFWRDGLGAGYKTRDLKPSNIAIEYAGDVAWAVFDWTFTGTMADDTPFQASGWETQVHRKTERGWRISHVHYSVPPPPPPGAAPPTQ
jgi:ketosteroid isomerase-like protein